MFDAVGLFTLSECEHAVCYDCLLRTLLYRYEHGYLMQCPCAAARGMCNARVDSAAVHAILEGAYGSAAFPGHAAAEEILTTMEQRELQEMLDHEPGYVRCRGYYCTNGYVVDAAAAGEAVSVDCSECGQSFCSQCHELSHQGVRCADVPRLRTAWRAWCDREHQTYRKRLEEEERIAREATVALRSQRLQEFDRDEQAKETSCRYCPRCNAVIWKVDGYAGAR